MPRCVPEASLLSYQILPSVALAGLMVVATGCGRTRTDARVMQDLAQGRTELAQISVDKIYGGGLTEAGVPNDDVLDNSRNGLLWCLESAQIQRVAGNLSKATAILEVASRKVEELRTRWTTSAKLADIGSYIMNDTVSQYEGAAFEHVQVDWQRSLTQLSLAQIGAGLWQPCATMASLVGHIDSAATTQHYTNAISFARRMVLKELKEVLDASGSRRYFDDPAARLYAAALMDAIPDPSNDDRQFADAMLKGAIHAYRKHFKEFAGETSFRYEVSSTPDVATTLLIRNGFAYDPSGFQEWCQQNDVVASTAALRAPGLGSLLVLNDVDFVSRREPLQIMVILASGVAVGTYDYDAHHGRARFYMGGLAFSATGPGAENLRHWQVIPLPNALVEPMTTAGAPVVWYLELPAHYQDAPVASPAGITVLAEHSASPSAPALQVRGEVIADLDCYARISLRDEMAFTAVKTLTRVAVKQVTAWAVAQGVARDNKALGFLTGLLGSIGMSLTEEADLRGANLLPNRMEASLIDLAPGQYRIRIKDQDLGLVTIQANRTVILPARTFPSPVADVK